MTITAKRSFKIRPQGNGSYVYHTVTIQPNDVLVLEEATNIQGKDKFWIISINGKEVNDNLLVYKFEIEMFTQGESND